MTEKSNGITILVDEMLIEDLVLLEDAATGDLPARELVKFLNRVTEEDVTKYPLRRLHEITDELTDAVNEASNPETEAGN